MSERYSKLFSLPGNQYAEGAPVIISAGNLLKDNQTGRVLAQLKIRNIAAKPLKAATVLIHPQDAAGKPMEGDTQQKYLDLTAKTGEEFGQKTAMYLPDASTRGFSVEVTQAVFSDNSTWEGTAAPWEPLPAPESLSKLGDAELLKQYQLHFGGKCDVVPQEHKDLWLCACGAWNRSEKCYACVKGRESLFSLDLDALKAERDARLAKEKAEREAKEAADKAAAEAKAKKTKRTLAIILPLFVVCAAALLIITKIVIPNSRYNEAVALLEAGQYDDAITAFEALDGYKDSAEQLAAATEAKAEADRLAKEAEIEAEKIKAYEKAEALLSSGEYEEAIEAFEMLEDYRDSKEKAIEAKNAAAYEEACKLMEMGDYEAAAKAFLALGSYKDSQKKAEEAIKAEDYVWSVIGSFTEWARDIYLSKSEDGSYRSAPITMTADDQFKVRKNGSWEINYGITVNGEIWNYAVERAGTYIVIFYPNTGKIELQAS